MLDPVQQATHMLTQAWSDFSGNGGGIEGLNVAYNRNNPFTPLANLAYQENILTGQEFTWWGDYSENVGHFGLNMLAAVPVVQVARETDIFAGQVSTITRDMGMFNPGELMPNGQMAGVGPGAMYSGETPLPTTLYRGVGTGTANDAQQAAGGAISPRGGTATVIEHSAGNTASQFTSWTSDLSVAQRFAGGQGSGVIFQVNVNQIPNEVIDAAPFSTHPSENEFLLRGTVYGVNRLR